MIPFLTVNPDGQEIPQVIYDWSHLSEDDRQERLSLPVSVVQTLQPVTVAKPSHGRGLIPANGAVYSNHRDISFVVGRTVIPLYASPLAQPRNRRWTRQNN